MLNIFLSLTQLNDEKKIKSLIIKIISLKAMAVYNNKNHQNFLQTWTRHILPILSNQKVELETILAFGNSFEDEFGFKNNNPYPLVDVFTALTFEAAEIPIEISKDAIKMLEIWTSWVQCYDDSSICDDTKDEKTRNAIHDFKNFFFL